MSDGSSEPAMVIDRWPLDRDSVEELSVSSFLDMRYPVTTPLLNHTHPGCLATIFRGTMVESQNSKGKLLSNIILADIHALFLTAMSPSPWALPF